MHNEQYDYYFRLGEREGIENQLLLSAVHKFKSILPERHFSQFPHCYIAKWKTLEPVFPFLYFCHINGT